MKGAVLAIGTKPKSGGPPPPPPGMKDIPGHVGMRDDSPDETTPEEGDETETDDEPTSPEDLLRKMRDMIDKCLAKSEEGLGGDEEETPDETDDGGYGPTA